VKEIHNIAASIRQRLLNKSKAEQRPFNEVLQYYAMERFLYRISLSQYSKAFILKGALMLLAWNTPLSRPTKDIDMLGKTSNDENSIKYKIKEILDLEVIEDGIIFDSQSIHIETITEDADYEGIRVLFKGLLESARIHMQIDIGFGDIIYPEAEMKTLPAMLDLPSASILCYSIESSIAEKFEAMVNLGTLNSRMKDFYDIWMLSRQFSFSMKILREAIIHTFHNRSTELPLNMNFFDRDFIEQKNIQWNAFCKRIDRNNNLPFFEIIIENLIMFFQPILTEINTPQPRNIQWKPSGPWA
jgi:predicted nucleotidyltransferase component of viral defense system